ncbi:MAG TPA: bifunctional proline dehydrogenase/L-glutamate gamma-semialdehyde dehydrogenase [Methylomirabilota bacterium]|jgi:RHH-type proline utilization regulon transcriptional repressor/proline dehydrogenase/delta 1-pyrroline-5-carboxylate dehydrogenase
MARAAATASRQEGAERAVALAESLLAEARAGQTTEERARAERLARLMEDPRGKELTIALTDQCFRSRRPERIADQLHYLLERYGAPRFMEWWERIGLTLGALMGQYLPSLVVPPIVARLRHETEALILPAEDEDLRRYLAERRAAGIRLNLNQLGEAILGEAEAARRLEAYLALLSRDDVEYISVKVSSVSSQIELPAFRHTVDVVEERLRTLYRQAQRHRYRHPDGRVTPKFVNLDMEEYRDLDLTVTAFREVLDEPEFLALPAGIVLQAYLPESHRVQRALVAWATARCERGGAPIKLRVVKGANLAMERIEADLHGWPQAPYATKQEVDANFKRMVEYGCRREHAAAVHLGIASHNLFDVAYGMVLREAAGVLAWTEFEMLEGMANHQARAVQARAGGLLLYAPVVRAEDFHSAIAYLVRRLDENTAPDNFLRHVFGLEPGSPEWTLERDRFLAAFDLPDLSDAPRRVGVRSYIPTFSSADGEPRASHLTPFVNEADTDWALDGNRGWIERVRAEWQERPSETVPLQIAGEMVAGAMQVEGRDRSRPARVVYRHARADRAQVSRALDAARGAQAAWAGRPAAERCGLIDGAADVLARRRGDLIGAMIVDGAKTVTEADPEVSEAIDFARYYARAIAAGATVDGCRMESLGVVLVAPPWNFPLSIPAGGVLAALAAGNAVLLKPAPEAVLVGWHLANALWEAGIPRPLLQFVPCPDDDIGRALVTDPRVDAVILTGSVETARRFLEWRPDLRLLAETSGKNAMVVTALADRDQAIRDLVRSAFGHDGQKCSAASLAICEAEVYDDAIFRRQLRDAAASLAVGSAWEPASRVTPLTQPPGRALTRALTTLDEGEAWLLEPRRIDGPAPLWSPGIKLGVRRGSFFHRTECFGPVLGLMRAADLDEAIDLANDQPFGLTSGLQSLDDREVARWLDRIEAGNLYVNRSTTGAIVGRQPFGGWKASSVGSGAKAGGPNYVLQLGHWRQVARPSDRAPLSSAVEAELARGLDTLADDESRAMLRASAESYAAAWRDHFGTEHEPIPLLGERNVFRYRPCPRILVRAEASTPAGRLALAQVVLAARTCGVPVEISLAAGELDPGVGEANGAPGAIESEAELAARLSAARIERLRALTALAPATRAAAHAAGVTVLDAPVLATGRLELRAYLREQAVSRVVHRYGTVMDPADSP